MKELSLCFTCLLFLVTSHRSDEKNGQLSRQPSTPSRQNSRRSESGSERDRGEKERAADAGSGSGSGSSSGTVLQRRGSGKDKTRLLSSSNGTQSHPWKECCGREARVICPTVLSSYPLSSPKSFLPCLLPSCLASYIIPFATEWRKGKVFLEADLRTWRRIPHKWLALTEMCFCGRVAEACWADL